MYSVIIVDYNSVKITMKYIDTCLEKIVERKQLHFVIVDNMPHSRSEQILETEMQLNVRKKVYRDMCVLCVEYKDTEIRVIVTQKNLGYAKGNNVGINFSDQEWNDPYIVISNNDIEFNGQLSLESLCEVLKRNKRVAVVGPHIEDVRGNLHGPYQVGTAWEALIIQPIRELMELVFGRKKGAEKAVEIYYPNGEYYWVSGCFFVCAREKMRQVNNFDENTFLYGEEMILSERLKRIGYSMYYINDFRIMHRGSETIARSFKDFEAEENLYKSLYYYYKEYRNTNRLVLVLSKIVFALVKILFYMGKGVNHLFKIRIVTRNDKKK